MMSEPHPPFPSHETIAAFVERRLSGSERKNVIGHLAKCGNCRTAAREIRAEMNASAAGDEPTIHLAAAADRSRRDVVRGHFGSPAMRQLLAATAAVLFVVITGVAVRQWYRNRTGIPALASAAGKLVERPVRVRLSGPFAYRPPDVVRSGSREPVVVPAVIATAAASAQQRAEDDRSATNLHAYGVSELLKKNSAGAIAPLEDAIRKDAAASTVADAIKQSTNVPLLNDLAAAYIDRAEHAGPSEQLVFALAAVNRARQLDPRSPAVLFNRALVHEAMKLHEDAKVAWREYLAVDPSSEWSQEAKAHLERLNAIGALNWKLHEFAALRAANAGDTAAVISYATDYPHNLRRLAQETLFRTWGDHFLAGRQAEAETVLRAARTIGDALARKSGEMMIADEVTAIDRASRDADRLRRVATLHADYGRAQQTKDVSGRLASLRGVRNAFAAEGHPFRLVPHYQIVSALFSRGDYAECERELEQPFSREIDSRYVAAASNFAVMRGLILLASSRPAEAFAAYAEALTHANRSADPQALASVHRVLAEAHEASGEPALGWRHRLLALHSAVRAGSDGEVLNAIAACTRSAAVVAPHAALTLLDRQLALATALEKPNYVVTARIWRSVVAAAIDDTAAGIRELAEAERELSRVADPKTRIRSAANFAFIYAVHLNLPNKRARLDQGIEYAKTAAYRFRVGRLFLERARLSLQERRYADAETDYLAGLDELARQSQSVPDELMRDSLAEVYGDLFDDLIALQLVQKRETDAFRYAEARRTWLEQFDRVGQGVVHRAAQTTGFRKTLPAGAAVIEYVTLPDRLLIRVSSTTQETTRVIATSRSDLGTTIAKMLDDIASGSDATAGAAQLYEWLIAPIEEAIGRASTLAIIADAPVNSAPFAALRRNAAQPFLLEEYKIINVPSLMRLISGMSAPRRPVTGSVLLVANPDLPRDRATGYDALPGAELEAGRIESLYSQPLLLKGDDATATRFLQEAGRHSVVCVGTHAVVDERQPLLSALLFAGDRPDSVAALPAHVVARQTFGSTAVVVLGGCQTGRAGAGRRNAQPLTAAFLRADVPAVVGTLIDVKDGSAQHVLVPFHQFLTRGSDASEALRRAQLNVLASDRSPRSLRLWAPYQVTTQHF